MVVKPSVSQAGTTYTRRLVPSLNQEAHIIAADHEIDGEAVTHLLAFDHLHISWIN